MALAIVEIFSKSTNNFIILYYIILYKNFYYKKILYYNIIKKRFFFCPNINIINLSLDKLKLIAKNSNIQGYENKSGNDLIKILSEPKPKISITKKELKEIKKNFGELRQKFSKEEIDKCRKNFYNIKNHRNLYASEIREAEKNLTELEESIQFT